MRKRFKKRLLGIILTILMVVSVIPVQQVQPVKAAAGDMISAGTTIYLRPNAATTWISDGAVMAFKTSADNKQSEIVVMTNMDDGLTWYGTTTADATNIDFLRLNPNDTNTVWNEAGTWPGLESGKNLYTFALHTGVTPTGMWTTYSNTGSETTSYFNVNATLVDYFNNGRVEQPKNTLYNEGNLTGPTNAPYSQLNQWISNLQGYALNGVADSKNDNAPVPLYFGDLLHAKQAGGNLTWYWQGANVAFGSNKETASKDVAQGIVGKNLDDGNLITSYTNENGDPVKVPFFNEDAYPNQSKYMRFYNNLQFPFTKTTNDKGVSTYSFDSEQNTVHYDYENNKIVRDDTIKIHDVGGDTGYFPFNSVDPSSAKDNLNYGFGTQFTIPFTVTETGKNVDGTPMTFKFTGDDDVWVYIDGALVLDMGGAHCKAEGEINFATQMATITTGTSNAKLGNQPTAGGRVAAKDNGRRTVEFKNITVKKSDGKIISLADYMKESGKVHELKMYYMERGMWDSNMSISYSFVPLPSGLTLSKTLDTKDVNAGLKNAVQGLDNFDFNIQTKNLRKGEANYSDVENLGYTLYDYDDRTFPGQEAKDSTATFSSSYFASDFINTKDKNNSSAFYAGTGFQITESIPQGTKLQYDTSKTRWGVYDSITSRAAIEGGKGAVATFNMGDDTSSEMDVVNRYVNFVNTPKVGSLSVAKKYEGYAPENETFGFTVLVDLTGHDYYDSYKLEYTGTQNGTTDENGHFTLKAGETITFVGIPAGATYKVVEDKPDAGDTWEQDTAKCTKLTGTIVANTTSAAVVTNKTKTTPKNYVIYAEAGKTVTYAPDGVTITDLTAPITGDKDITTNVNKDGKGEFTPTSSNKKYDVNYEGTTTDKGNFAGKITVLTYEATNKVYVFDYGLESNIAKTNDNNDGLFQDGTFYNDIAEKNGYATTAKLNKITHEEDDNQQTTITVDQNVIIDKNGSATGAVTFKPIAFMDKVENYNYTADITKNGATLDSKDPETGTTVHGTIKTMPASVVYYEDNFANEVTVTDKDGIKIVNSTPINLSQSNSQTELYGHDNAYADTANNDSAGSSTEMTVGAKATFTFKGTGFDLISRTSGTSGSIVYKVKNMDTNTVATYGAVDTYYNNGDLYQLPVISIKNLAYAKYEVTLLVPKSNMESASTFYLDGVRIYNPLNDDEEKNASYIKNEVSVKTTSIREMILGTCEITESGINDPDSGSYITSAEVPGSTSSILYCAGDENAMSLSFLGDVNQEDMNQDASATYSNSLAEYLRRGPSNEVYLTGTTGIGFVVKADGTADSTLQVEAKTVDMSTETEGIDTTLSMVTKTTDGYAKRKISAINTKTAMYYNIPVENAIPLKDGNYLVVLTGTATDTQCISLTNLKQKGYTISSPADTANKALVKDIIESAMPVTPEYGVDVSFVKFSSALQSGKKVTAEVTVPEGSEVDGFQVYANENPITTKMVKGETKSGQTTYKVMFNMTKARGKITLDFVPYKFDTDGVTRIESELYLRKTAVVRR